jgi:flagellar hook-length control protein FliK
MTMHLPVMPSTNYLAQHAPTMVSVGNQQGTQIGGRSSSKVPFAQLLQNLFVTPSETKTNDINQNIFPGSFSGEQNPVVGHLSNKPELDNASDNSVSSPTSEEKKSNVGQGKEIDYSGVASLILGITSAGSIIQPASEPIDDTAPNSNGSTQESPQPIATKIEQYLAELLTISKRPGDASESGLSELNSLSASAPSGVPSSGNDFMTMLSRKVAENPSMKENLLRLVSDSSNSSMNRSLSAEIEKILSRISAPGSQITPGDPQTNLSEKSSGGIAEAFGLQQAQAKSLSANILSNEKLNAAQQRQAIQPTRDSSQNYSDGKIAQNSSGKFSETTQLLSHSSGDKDSVTVSLLQSAAGQPVEVGKLSIARESQSTAKTGNISTVSDKPPVKAVFAFGKQNTDGGSTGQTKHDAPDIYTATSMDSRVDLRFKQEFTSAVENGHDTAFTKPDLAQVSQSIVREARLMTQENRSVVNVKLEPESLGSVVLRVSSDNGKISAEFNVRTTDAHQYLQSSIPELKQTLQSNGVTLSNLSVNLSGGESQTRQQQYPTRKNSQKFSMDTDPIEAARNFGYNTMELKV